MNPLNPVIVPAITVGISIVVVVTLVSTAWWFNAIRKSSKMQNEGMDIGHRSIELMERAIQLQEEANDLLRELIRKTR